jgi:HD-GYP domain-containing protein (c-di-GMP phosphodiesterase class II)
MTTDRSYRRAMSTDEAIIELRINSGTQFDPNVVDTLVAIVQRQPPEPSVTAHTAAHQRV